jgi:hypothetical protein
MTCKFSELGALLLVLLAMGGLAFLYVGPRDQDAEDYPSQQCDQDH